MSTYISEHFTLEELIQSPTAQARHIANIPDKAAEANLIRLVKEVLEPIRAAYGHPLHINSGYRGPELNAATGGSKTSQHMLGQAADLSCTATSKAELFRTIKGLIDSGRLKVGQLIWEFGTKQEPAWVHVSLPYKKVNNILYLYK